MLIGGSGFGVDELAVTERMDRSSYSKEKAISDSRPAERPNTHIIAQLSKDLSDLLHTNRGSSIPPSSNRPALEATPSMDVLPAVREAAVASTKPVSAHSQIGGQMPLQHMPMQTTIGNQPPPPVHSSGPPQLASNGPQAAAPAQMPFKQVPFSQVSIKMPFSQVTPSLLEPRCTNGRAESEVAPQVGGGRSPREVQVLLNSIESREAALRAKVEHLAEEKSAQQQRLEEQVRELQRTNAQMEAELQRRQRPDSELFSIADSDKDVLTRPEFSSAMRDGYVTPNEVAEDAPYSRLPMEDFTRQSSAIQETREDLQQQLAEIRSEVARCASALCGDEPLPTSEVADIRQQLSALSNEVMQTSRALLVAPGLAAQLQGPSRDSELIEVRRQLEGLQSQVSHVMYTALSRPGIPTRQDTVAAQANELSELRAEVGRLRTEVSRNVRLGSEVHPAKVEDLGAQIGALRLELGSFVGGMRASKPLPRGDVRQPAVNEAAGLQERLSWLRAEVAKVIHDPRHAVDPAHPELRLRLNALLQELQDLRQGAEVVAASNGGSPRSRRSIPGLRETELRYPMSQSVPFAPARSSTPKRHGNVYYRHRHGN